MRVNPGGFIQMILSLMYRGIGFLFAALTLVAVTPVFTTAPCGWPHPAYERHSRSRWRKSKPTRICCARNSLCPHVASRRGFLRANCWYRLFRT